MNERETPELVGTRSTGSAMQAVTLRDAKRNLARLVEQVLADAEPRIVVTDKGEQVVVMPLDEFNSWKETLYLLASPANAAHLRRSIAEADSGQAEKRELTAE
jgi:antitoxin YefM